MNTFMNNLKKMTSQTTTENGDIAYNTTMNSNLDFFGSAGSNVGQFDTVKELFQKAFSEDKRTAIANLIYLRDVRGGQGQRELFRHTVRELKNLDKQAFLNMLKFIPEFGRWDDLMFLLSEDLGDEVDKTILLLVIDQLREDLDSEGNVSLMAKWLPSTKTKKEYLQKAKRKILKYFKSVGLNEKDYRQMLSTLRAKINILETYMSNKDYTFDYEKLPSKALSKHIKAFKRNDEERYDKFVKNGVLTDSKARVMFPVEIVQMARRGTFEEQYEDIAEKYWNAMTKDSTDKKIIVVRDDSGSMYRIAGKSKYSCYNVATSLAIYSAERLTGDFRNKFISFSTNPKFIELPDSTLIEKLKVCDRYSEISNTDIEKTYNLIFEAQKNAKEEDRIDKVLILSDLQFDKQTEGEVTGSTFENIRKKFEGAGMKMPEMIYWNLSVGETVTFPENDQRGIYVSGFNANMFDELAKGEIPNPIDFMNKTLSKYDDMVENILK